MARLVRGIPARRGHPPLRHPSDRFPIAGRVAFFVPAGTSQPTNALLRASCAVSQGMRGQGCLDAGMPRRRRFNEAVKDRAAKVTLDKDRRIELDLARQVASSPVRRMRFSGPMDT